MMAAQMTLRRRIGAPWLSTLALTRLFGGPAPVLLLGRGGQPPPANLIPPHRKPDDHPDDHLLVVLGRVKQPGPVGDPLHQERPDERPPDRPHAPEQAGPADHAGGN